MAVTVIHLLEMIKIQHDKRVAGLDDRRHPGLQPAAVADIGQAVDLRRLPQAAFGPVGGKAAD
ncbi:hypothetical protein IP70_06140 [alpha proteobacterium AAP38]|nr:hypothetical protein IP70_06140 [alpha proteobacterium AAP38]